MDPEGVSLAVEIKYSAPALPYVAVYSPGMVNRFSLNAPCSGTTLGIVCTTMSNKGKIRSSRAEVSDPSRSCCTYLRRVALQIYNKETGQLVATGSQSIMPIGLGGGTSSKRSKM